MVGQRCQHLAAILQILRMHLLPIFHPLVREAQRDSTMTKPMLDDYNFRTFVDRMTPFGRIGLAEDVAAVVLYFASPNAHMVTGTSFLDGG